MKNLVTNSPSKEYFEAIYRNITTQYNTLTKKMGPSCPNAMLLLKFIWIQEVAKDGHNFFRRIEENDWR